MRSERINPNVERFYNFGDPVFFFDEKKKQLKKATALIRLGKTLYLRFGNFLRRVAIEKVRPDINGEIMQEESYADYEKDTEDERFKEEETPVIDMAADLELAEQNKDLHKKMEDLVSKDKLKSEKIVSLEAELAILNESKDITNVDEKETENIDDDEERIKEDIMLKRIEKKKNQKAKKLAEKMKVPKTGQNILFRDKESNGWKSGRIVGGWKKNSKYQYWKHVMIDKDQIVEKDFENGIYEWKTVEEPEMININEVDEETTDNFYLEPYTNDGFPVQIVPRKNYGKPEVQEAIEREISKFKNFKAFKEVDDNGEKSIPTKWVITEQPESGKNEPYKARLCMRGDLEQGKDKIRTDSPTASKEALKLALIIAANEGFKVQSGDIKSAYLQGDLIDREVFVRPPKEANADGKLWLLVQGAYGIVDGGRLFYLKLSEKLRELGLYRIHSDGALFSYVTEGKLHGVVTTHSDDLILAGDDTFDKDIVSKL